LLGGEDFRDLFVRQLDLGADARTYFRPHLCDPLVTAPENFLDLRALRVGEVEAAVESIDERSRRERTHRLAVRDQQVMHRSAADESRAERQQQHQHRDQSRLSRRQGRCLLP